MDDENDLPESEGFEELVKYTVPGYVLGFITGIFLDMQGYQTSSVGQWLVRTLSGEGENIMEGNLFDPPALSWWGGHNG